MDLYRNKKGQFIKGCKIPKEILEKRTETVIGSKHKDHVNGKNHKCWKGGKPKCIDCGKSLSSIYAKRCIKCSSIMRSGKNSYFWKGGTSNSKCEICGKKISFYAKRCRKHFKNGEEHPKYIKDRSKLVKRQKRNDAAYCGWRLDVYKRDNYKCRINNSDCGGRIIAHHILGWKEYPELRYNINNGITLCQAHHPLKRAEEKRLIPVFTELVAVSN